MRGPVNRLSRVGMLRLWSVNTWASAVRSWKRTSTVGLFTPTLRTDAYWAAWQACAGVLVPCNGVLLSGLEKRTSTVGLFTPTLQADTY